jgi:hypothetical protein
MTQNTTEAELNSKFTFNKKWFIKANPTPIEQVYKFCEVSFEINVEIRIGRLWNGV